MGFKNIYILDIAEQPLNALKKRLNGIRDKQLIISNFFEHQGSYDLIIEQTFFCALDPELRGAYSAHMHQLLNIEGTLSGLLFNFPLTEQGPPFGGDLESYQLLFEPYFSIKTLAPCYNSEPSRRNKELFFIFNKK